MAAKLKTFTGEEARAMRKKLGLNQKEFWGPLGITQSGGSRYERDRNIPGTVQRLLVIAHGTDKQCQAVIDSLRKRDDK